MITEIVLAAGAIGIYKYLRKPVGEYELKLGYESMMAFPKPILVSMKTTPHLFVCGLSGSGKSCMIEYAMRGKNVILINAFEDDFKSIKGRRIIGNDNILKFFENLLTTHAASSTAADENGTTVVYCFSFLSKLIITGF